MSQHPVDEMTEGCRFCAGEQVPEVITRSCGWCGRKQTYILLVTVKEADETTVVPLTELTVVPSADLTVTP